MLKIKRVISLILSGAICIMGSENVFADTSNEYYKTKQEIVEHVVNVNKQMGLSMTSEELDELNLTLDEMFKDKKDKNKNNLAKKYLKELKNESPVQEGLGVTPRGSSNDIGNVQLPTSSTGDIFFTDNSMPYNHVGMYISSTAIIESMPKDGVQYWSVSNKEAWQSPVKVNGLNNSCILRVSSATQTQRNNAASWAKSQKGKSYDTDFLNNKQNTTAENSKYNCSELVWKAYKFKANKDLDSNGGLAVYPNNIKNSSLTKYVRSF